MPFSVSGRRAQAHWIWLRRCPRFVRNFRPSPVWTIAPLSLANSNHCGQQFSRKSIASVERLWSTPFVIPERSVSILNLNTPTETRPCEFVTTGEESISKFSTRDERDTGASPECASVPLESVGYSKSPVAQPVEQRSNSPSRAMLRSNSQLTDLVNGTLAPD